MNSPIPSSNGRRENHRWGTIIGQQHLKRMKDKSKEENKGLPTGTTTRPKRVRKLLNRINYCQKEPTAMAHEDSISAVAQIHMPHDRLQHQSSFLGGRLRLRRREKLPKLSPERGRRSVVKGDPNQRYKTRPIR